MISTICIVQTQDQIAYMKLSSTCVDIVANQQGRRGRDSTSRNDIRGGVQRLYISLFTAERCR